MMDTTHLSHVSEFSVKAQWAFGGITGFGSGVLTFLGENYYAFGAIGIIGGLAVGVHGGYWLYQIKRIEKQNKLLEQETRRLELERLKQELL
jgi:hypothetical protein